ncbi:F-box protein At3g07870-like [Papaver somniferum]|uniref:F-box protein At3g07870-like n=1 Tax=Papaver somniferum TaxID=3469 RepID=UPI000E7016E3|nr:F-box protein At3g07870-like [Papaver somniferum]
MSVKSGTEVQLYYGDKYEVNLEQYYSNKTLTKLDRVKDSLRGTYSNCCYHLVDSCNGLVCIQSYNGQLPTFGGICNPVTGECLFLPGLREPKYPGWRHVGFGYLPSTNEYKVVRCTYNGARKGHVEVYTLGSQSGWRRKENIPYRFYSSGLLANGAIHWIGETGQPGAQQVYKIVAYDLVDEKFKYVLSLPFSNFKRYDGRRLVLLGGNLCAVHYIGCRDKILVWALKKRIENTRILQPKVTREGYYNHEWGWSEEFSMTINHEPMNYWYMPFAITKNNEILLWHEHRQEVYCYDNNSSTFTKLWEDDGKGSSCVQAIPHMNTLVSLKDLGECCGDDDVTSADDENSKISKQCKKRKC